MVQLVEFIKTVYPKIPLQGHEMYCNKNKNETFNLLTYSMKSGT